MIIQLLCENIQTLMHVTTTDGEKNKTRLLEGDLFRGMEHVRRAPD